MIFLRLIQIFLLLERTLEIIISFAFNILNNLGTMKIGMILDDQFPPDPRVVNEAVSLIKEGHEIFLFCLDLGGTKLPKKDVHLGINIRRYKCGKFVYKLSALAYTIPLYHLLLKAKIKDFLKKNDIQIIHVHDMKVARSVFWLNRDKKLKIVLDLHENRPEIMKYYSHVKSLIGRTLIHPKLWKKYEYKYIRMADYVIVVTNSAKRYYQKEVGISENKIKVVPNTIRKEFYTEYSISQRIEERYKNDFVILYLGETGLRRGTLDLIRSIPLLINHIPNIKLVIVGKSKDDSILKKETKKLNIQQYVDLTGWQPFKLFQSYISSSKIGCSPLHKNIHHDTTYANKIFQYSSLALPIIVSDSTAQKEIVEELKNGLVHKEKDPKSIAEAIKKIYNNQELYNKMSANSVRGIREKYNWEQTSKELKSIYKRSN